MKISLFLESFFRRSKIFGGAILLISLAGFLTEPLERLTWKSARGNFENFRPEMLEKSTGTGVVLGTLGGFRTVIADIAWLRAFHFWEKREADSCLKYAKLAMVLSPEQLFFLENVASFVAFDFPVWEIRRRGGFLRVPENVQREIQKKALSDSLKILEDSTAFFSENPKIFILAAQIVTLKTELIYGQADFEKAANYYRRACEQPGAPWYAFASYSKFVAEHIPSKKTEAELFLKYCLDTAKTQAEKQLFRELIEEFFSK